LSHSTSPIFVKGFPDRVLWNLPPGMASNLKPPDIVYYTVLLLKFDCKLHVYRPVMDYSFTFMLHFSVKWYFLNHSVNKYSLQTNCVPSLVPGDVNTEAVTSCLWFWVGMLKGKLQYSMVCFFSGTWNCFRNPVLRVTNSTRRGRKGMENFSVWFGLTRLFLFISEVAAWNRRFYFIKCCCHWEAVGKHRSCRQGAALPGTRTRAWFGFSRCHWERPQHERSLGCSMKHSHHLKD
jgi:hypothetical protein